MPEIKEIFAANRDWAQRMLKADPEFFDRLVNLQTPRYLWIGCSDSRVPANQITGLEPGEVFVHRNVANVAPRDDTNCQAVVEYAVDILGVSHIIVCGHYGCGGVEAALNDNATGHALDWISGIVGLRDRHAEELGALADMSERHARLCELNVINQVENLMESAVVRRAWARGVDLTLHGWIYKLSDGLLKNLNVSINGLAADK